MVKIDFEFECENGNFRDCIILPDDHGLTDQEIEQIKVNRFETWKSHVEIASNTKDSFTFDGVSYRKLDSVPPPGATLKEVDGVWYYKD